MPAAHAAATASTTSAASGDDTAPADTDPTMAAGAHASVASV